jgi:hypothetical protein
VLSTEAGLVGSSVRASICERFGSLLVTPR